MRQISNDDYWGFGFIINAIKKVLGVSKKYGITKQVKKTGGGIFQSTKNWLKDQWNT